MNGGRTSSTAALGSGPASRAAAALVAEHLGKRFGDRVAFDDVSFEVGYGEVFGCRRVAILNTTLRLVGRPEELRAQLFKGSLKVRLRAELADPASVFAGIAGVEGWEAAASGSYLLTVADPDAAAPKVARALVRTGADILSIAESRHSLEDVYLELVDEDVEAKRR